MIKSYSICCNCTKAIDCSIFRTLYSMSQDFCINDCKDFDEMSDFKYRKIAENDDLMHLIYDYFTNNLTMCSEDEAKKILINAIENL